MSEQTIAEIAKLADEVLSARGFDNALDVRCEIALFEPDELELAIRPNAAGTKVIVTINGGRDRTFIARDFTMSRAAREKTAAALRQRALLLSEGHDHDRE